MVQTNTVQGPGGEAGVMRIKGTSRGLAMALDGNERWCYLDPKLGAAHAVAEAARKVACTGATPIAATNCLNFGNPEKPDIIAQLSKAVPADFQRVGDAVLLLTFPVDVPEERFRREFGSSEYAKTILGELWGVPP